MTVAGNLSLTQLAFLAQHALVSLNRNSRSEMTGEAGFLEVTTQLGTRINWPICGTRLPQEAPVAVAWGPLPLPDSSRVLAPLLPLEPEVSVLVLPRGRHGVSLTTMLLISSSQT